MIPEAFFVLALIPSLLAGGADGSEPDGSDPRG